LFSELEPSHPINPCASEDGPGTEQDSSSQSLTLTLPLSGFQRTDVVFTTRAFNPTTTWGGLSSLSVGRLQYNQQHPGGIPIPGAARGACFVSSRNRLGRFAKPSVRDGPSRGANCTASDEPCQGPFLRLSPDPGSSLWGELLVEGRVKLISGGDLLSHTLGACSTIGAEGLN
jgi:hypothetical protein